MGNAETNVPGVSADRCHHESRPAELVPGVDVCAFLQEPGERETRSGRKRAQNTIKSQNYRIWNQGILSRLQLRVETRNFISQAAQKIQHKKLNQPSFSSAPKTERTGG